MEGGLFCTAFRYMTRQDIIALLCTLPWQFVSKRLFTQATTNCATTYMQLKMAVSSWKS